jgi:hypothetical protein
MNPTDGPIMISAAIFVSLIFLDLFRHEYKLIPIHAIIGLFSVVLMGVLCERKMYFLAWFLLLLPFVFMTTGFILRQNKLSQAPQYPTSPLQNQKPKNQAAPYYM